MKRPKMGVNGLSEGEYENRQELYLKRSQMTIFWNWWKSPVCEVKMYYYELQAVQMQRKAYLGISNKENSLKTARGKGILLLTKPHEDWRMCFPWKWWSEGNRMMFAKCWEKSYHQTIILQPGKKKFIKIHNIYSKKKKKAAINGIKWW